MGLSTLYLFLAASLIFFLTIIAFARRYKRCPSDKILVIYGKISGGGTDGLSAKCLHGGAAFIWPVLQNYRFLDLTPMAIDINLQGALSHQNIRINTPSTFTVGISTVPGVMENAAERLLDVPMDEIAELARDIIFGQMRVVLATMPIEEINADRDKLIENIFSGVEVELKKVGLRLINVNIHDITDESGYIDALGKEAAAHAINEAKVAVAQKERDGNIGAAEAQRDQRIQGHRPRPRRRGRKHRHHQSRSVERPAAREGSRGRARRLGGRKGQAGAGAARILRRSGEVRARTCAARRGDAVRQCDYSRRDQEARNRDPCRGRSREDATA